MYPIGFFCTHASRAFFTPLSRLGDEQMLRILGRGHSVPTVTELIIVRGSS
jgi:hypothetical protein